MSTDALIISVEDGPTLETLASIDALMNKEALSLFGESVQIRTFCAALRDGNGHVEGGIKAKCHWGWLRIDALVVAELTDGPATFPPLCAARSGGVTKVAAPSSVVKDVVARWRVSTFTT